ASSIKDRSQKRPCGLSVETNTHERHRLDYAQPVLQTPAEQCTVAGGQEEPWTQERWGRPDERFQLFVCLAYRMPKERDRGGITSDTAVMLNHGGPSLFDRIE